MKNMYVLQQFYTVFRFWFIIVFFSSYCFVSFSCVFMQFSVLWFTHERKKTLLRTRFYSLYLFIYFFYCLSCNASLQDWHVHRLSRLDVFFFFFYMYLCIVAYIYKKRKKYLYPLSFAFVPTIDVGRCG